MPYTSGYRAEFAKLLLHLHNAKWGQNIVKGQQTQHALLEAVQSHLGRLCCGTCAVDCTSHRRCGTYAARRAHHRGERLSVKRSSSNGST